MEERVTSGIKALLENYWITLEKNSEEYYEIKENLNEIGEFFRKNLGWDLVSNKEVIKVEKIPGGAKAFMGIPTFQDILDYLILCALLLSLEDKEEGEQFLLSDITEKIAGYLKEYTPVDWQKIAHRRSLVRVFEYAQNLGLFIKNDGDIARYSEDIQTEVLYEKSILSRFFSIRHKDILNFSYYEEIEKSFSKERDKNIGNYVYREFLTSPAIYWEDNMELTNIYIKNNKNELGQILKEYVDGNLHIHKNSAFLGFEKASSFGEIYPESSTLVDIVLFICGKIREVAISRQVKKECGDFFTISKKEILNILEECKNRYSIYWSQEYRDMSILKIYDKVVKYMEDWEFLKVDEDILVYSAVGKFVGVYGEKKGVANEE